MIHHICFFKYWLAGCFDVYVYTKFRPFFPYCYKGFLTMSAVGVLIDKSNYSDNKKHLLELIDKVSESQI